MKKLLFVLVLVWPHLSFAEKLPEGWYVTGSAIESYVAKRDTKTGMPAPSGYLASLPDKPSNGFGTVMQAFTPTKYLGKRVKMTAYVKSKDVTAWAGLWMRVDTDEEHSVNFDNMENRPIKGTTPWTRYSIVLDVPQDSIKLSYGALTIGEGEIWFDEFKFEIVDTSVPTTGTQPDALDKPRNNSF